MIHETESHATANLHAPVVVVRGDGHFRVLTTRPFAEGEVVLRLEGREVRRPTRYTIQIDRDLHLESEPGEGFEAALDRRPWRFLNHSCRPVTRLVGRDLVALRPLAAWEQVTFDYNTTEVTLAAPFACRCGAEDCCGVVRGFTALDDAGRRRRAPLLASHLATVDQDLERADGAR
ncbi:MAG: SET domain-containing protein [Planctomycetota bacterium]